MIRRLSWLAIPLLAVPFTAAPVPEDARGTTWPMYGGSGGRNPVNLHDRNIPAKFDPEKDCLWKADLGSRTYGHPVVAAGKVFVGTNNERPRNPRDGKTVDGEVEPLDKGVLMCFDEKTGKFLWQAVFDKIHGGQAQDWPREGVCSSPVVEGGRLYFVTNRCTVVCADVNGLTDGRQGATVREKYSDPTDADIFWEYDMRAELKVFPHNMSASHPLIVGDLLYVGTSNGVDETHFNLPSPEAPSFIALNKHTGKLVWADNSPGKNVMHGQWSSPAYTADPVPQVIFPGGDGWLRAFDPPTGKLLWQFDLNPKDAVHQLGGTGTKNDCVAPPSIYNGRLYLAVAQDPEHTDGIGRLWCIDIKKATENGPKRPDHDVSPDLLFKLERLPGGGVMATTRPNPGSAGVWCFTGEDKRPFATFDFKMGRTLCTACVVDDVLYIGDLPGYFHCLDARTGREFWRYDTRSEIWFGPCYADGKVFIGTTNAELLVWKHVNNPETIDDHIPAAPDKKATRALQRAKYKEVADKYLLAKIEFDTYIRTVPCVAGGVLYVATEKTLYAIGKR